MISQDFIFKRTPNANLKYKIFLLTLIIQFILFYYFMPGWAYLKSNYSLILNEIGLGEATLILVIFHLLFASILYSILLQKFLEKVHVKFISDDKLEIYTKNDGIVIINKNNSIIRDRKLIIDSSENNLKLTLNIDSSDYFELFDVYNTPNNRISRITETNREVFIKNPFLLFILITATSLITLYGYFKLIGPYETGIGIVLRMKGTLLNITLALPILSLICVFVFIVIKKFFRISEINFSENKILIRGKFKNEIIKAQVKEIKFIERAKNKRVKSIIFKSSNFSNYLLLFPSDTTIMSVIQYFDLKSKQSIIKKGNNKDELVELYRL